MLEAGWLSKESWLQVYIPHSGSPFRLSSKGRGLGGGGEMLIFCQADQGLSPEKLSRKKEWKTMSLSRQSFGKSVRLS